MPMRRSDRRTSNDDNAQNYVRSQRPEPVSSRELKTRLLTVQSQRDEAKQQLSQEQTHNSTLLRNIEAVKEERDKVREELQDVQNGVRELRESTQQWHAKAENFQKLYLNEQGKVQIAKRDISAASDRIVYLHTELEKTLSGVQELETLVAQTDQLYKEEKQKYDSLFVSYQIERERANDLLSQYEQADVERQRYASLYQEAREDLKFERRSKAGIKSWETRRKRENERLKSEISDMVILLKESIDRKEEAVQSLVVVAERMDRIQDLVESVEGDDSSPLGLVQKFQKIWQTVREILSE